LNDSLLDDARKFVVARDVQDDGVAGFQFSGDVVKSFQIGDVDAIDALD
jgi:hypothetical protein